MSAKANEVRRATGLPRQSFGRARDHGSGNVTGPVGKAVRDGLERNVWTFRAVDVIASNAALLPVVQRDGDPETGPPVEGHPLLGLLNRRPNLYESAFSFRWRLSATLLLSTKGAFVEVLRDRTGAITALHLLAPDQVKPVPNARTFVERYEVGIGADSYRLPPEAVLWLRRPHPDPYRSLTPLEAAGLAVETDLLARIYNRNFMRRDGRPGGILAIAGEVDDVDAAELEARFSGGPDSAGRTTVLEADDIEWVDVSTRPRDAQYLEGRESSKTETLIAFGVPESMTGNASGRTFANADVERETFWLDTMPGHLKLLSSAFDTVDDDLDRYIAYDLSGVGVLQRDLRAKAEHMLDEVNGGVRTVDEYRDVMPDLDVLGVAESSTLFLPVARTPYVVTTGDEPPLPPLRVAAAAGLAGLGVKQTDDDADEFVDVRDVHASLLDRWESTVQRSLARFFRRQERVTIEKLTGPKARRGTRHYEPPGQKQVDPSDIFDVRRWRAELGDEAAALLVDLFDEVGSATADTLGVDVWNLHDPAVTAALDARTNRIAGTVDTTWEAIKDELQRGERHGDSIEDLARRVRRVFRQASRLRSRTIARTEVVGSVNNASFLSAQQSGVVSKKMWLSAKDARVRDDHVAADGQTRYLAEPFTVGGSLLMHPGDAAGPAAQVINCRCTHLYVRDVAV